MEYLNGAPLHHLDFLRASMMILGVLVHASHADFDNGEYEIIRFLSGSFRMACFFIIAGFFSLLVINKTTTSIFLKNRMLLLGVTALLCIFAVVPVTIYWMNTYFFEGGSNNEPHSGWMGHSWFLFVLIFYNIFLGKLSYFLDFSVTSLAKILGVIGSQVLLIILLILISMLAVKIIQMFGSSLPYNNHWRWLATATFQNLPYFMLGMMMYKWQNVYKLLHSKPILWVFTAVTLVVTKWQLGLYEITSTTQHLTFMLITFGTAITVSAALFSLTSQLINRKNQAINIFSESAYTVYILHYIIIAVVLVQLQRLNVTMPVRMLVVCFVAAVGGVCVHLFIVKKFWPAEFLLNGKLRIKK